jgi:hypothetical protein
MKELSPDARAYVARVIEQEGMPPGLAHVLQLGVPPGAVSAADLEVLFPADRFTLLATGPALIDTTTTLPSGDVIAVPAPSTRCCGERPWDQGRSDHRTAAR